MRNEDIKVKQQNELLINPKFYPLIWVVVAFCAFVRAFYQTYEAVLNTDNIAIGIYNGLVSFVIGGASYAFLILFMCYFLYYLGARRGLRAIPQKDFTYITMIFVAIAWFISGMVNLFSFIEPALVYCNIFTTEFVAMTVSLALMFFLVFVPNYLNPKQAEKHFKFYGKIYVIFNSVVYILGAIGILSCITVAEDPALLAQMDNVYYTINGTDIPIAVLFEYYSYAKTGMEISAYIAMALSVLMIVAYFVLAYMLKIKAKDFKEEVKPENMEGIFFTDGKNFYTVDDIKNGSFGAGQGNPFGGDAPKGSENPFDDDDKDDKVFDEFDI